VAYTDSDGEGSRNFITTYQDICTVFSCKENTVSTAINKLAALGYISKKQFLTKKPNKISRRKKKSCWEISALFPQTQMEILLQQPDRQNLRSLTTADLRLYGIDQKANSSKSTVSESLCYHTRSADPHKNSQYYNKNNISNINKNTDQISEILTTNAEAITKANNVFIDQELTASEAEIAQGLQIAEKFDKKTFELAEKIPYNQAIKQADLTITQTERWLVTKAAYTLQKNQALLAKAYEVPIITKNSETAGKINASDLEAKLRLIELWQSFPDTVAELETTEEFLLRKSWLLKLLAPTNAETTILPIDSQLEGQSVAPSPELELPVLPGDKQDKARKFAYALRERGSARGYAAEIKVEELALEFIYHAATWVPERLNCKTRAEQIDAALSFAWRAVEQGRWQCPYQWLNLQIKQREQEAAKWRQW
jgi:hypothetical protein